MNHIKSFLNISLLLATLICVGCKDEKGDVEVNASVAKSMSIETSLGPFGVGPGMEPTYSLSVTVSNPTGETKSFKYLNAFVYSTDGDALQILCFQKSKEPDPFLLKPGGKITFKFDTDGYTTTLEQTNAKLHLAVALANSPFEKGDVVEAELPSMDELPYEPEVSLGRAKAPSINLLNKQPFELKSNRTPKNINEWVSRPSIIRDYESYRVVYMYFQAKRA